MILPIPRGWQKILVAETKKTYYHKLKKFLEKERQKYKIFPAEQDIFAALKLTPFNKTKVLLLGQDPYHDDGQAHGLCFSVRRGVPPPPSLVNIYKELQSDIGCRIPPHGHLVYWAKQGVLMLNAVLTVRAHQAGSHRQQGWEIFTDAIIQALNARSQPVVFLLWGNYAREKTKFIDRQKHVIIQSAHPSPLSAHNGFFGSRPFSKTNAALRKFGAPAIDWEIPER